MDRLSLWTMGLLALGWQAGFAVAAEPDDGMPERAPAASQTSAGPELLPVAFQAPQSTEMSRPPDLPPGIPLALVPPASIPQVAGPELVAAPAVVPELVAAPEPVVVPELVAAPAVVPELVAPPRLLPRPAAPVQHVTCPGHEPKAAAQTACPPGEELAAPETASPPASVPGPPRPVAAVPAKLPAALMKKAEPVGPAPVVCSAPTPTANVPVTQPAALVQTAAPDALSPNNNQSTAPQVSGPGAPASQPSKCLLQLPPPPPAAVPGSPPAVLPNLASLPQTGHMPAVQSLELAPAVAPPAPSPACTALPGPATLPPSASAGAAKPGAPPTQSAAKFLPATAPVQLDGPVLPLATSRPGEPLPFAARHHDELFVGPLLPQDAPVQPAAGSADSALAALAFPPAEEVGPPAPGVVKASHESLDSWHLGEQCRDLWGECCNYATREPVVTANIGLDILKPYWKSNPAFLVSTTAVTPAQVRVTDFDYTTQVVPQFTLGVMAGDDFGFRFGWWGFASQNSEFAAVGPAGFAASAAPLGIQIPAFTTEGIVASSKLRFDVWDFEAFELFHPCHWSLLASAGIRYAHISQDYNAFELSADGATLSSVLSGHNFNGAGPTLSLTGKRPFGESNFYVYGNTRGSILFGGSRQTASAVVAGIDLADVNDSGHDVLPELEFELGLGWYRELGQARFFAQVGLVGQAWFEAGNSSRSYIPGVFLSPTDVPSLVGGQADGTLGLFGLSMRAGVNY